MILDLGQYVSFPDGYRPTNPSIARQGRDLLVSVRGVAYTLDATGGVQGTPNRLPSLTRCFLLNDDLTFKGAAELAPGRLDGIEDLKLFSGLGRVWGVGSMPVGEPGSAPACVMTLVVFDAGLTDCRLVPLASPFGFRLEKNWAPFFADGALHFIYSCEPSVLLRFDESAGSLEVVGSRRPDREALKFLEGGSSGGFTTDLGMVFLTHRRVVRLPSRRRIYLSRVRRLSGDFSDLAAGPFFSIGRPTIQFSNGMVLERDRVLIAYGEMDGEARLASFSRSRFARAVFPAAGRVEAAGFGVSRRMESHG